MLVSCDGTHRARGAGAERKKPDTSFRAAKRLTRRERDRCGARRQDAKRLFEQVQRLPRRQQDKICELLEPYLAKNATSEKAS